MRTRFSLLCCLVFAPAAWALDWTGLESIGDLQHAARTPAGVELACAGGGRVQLSVLAPDLIRVRAFFPGQPAAAPDHSWAIARTAWSSVPWQLQENPATVSLTTSQLELVVRRHPLLLEFRDASTHRVINGDQRPMARGRKSGVVAAAKRFGFDEHFYGLGEKAAHLDRRRGEFQMWNSDTPAYVEGTDPIYQSIPFYLGWEDGKAYGIFYDNSYRSHFDLGASGQEAAEYEADGGLLDYYFFGGPALKQIVSRYTELTGRMPLPPLWALGNQQCRYSYYPDTMVEEVARTYRAHDLPLDALYLDIHYMNGYRVFTWNPERFPHPAELMKRLAQEGVKVVTIIDPGVKYQPAPAGRAPAAPPAGINPGIAPANESYYVYNQGLAQNFFLRRTNGNLYIGKVWPGEAVFVDYTKPEARRWWGDLHRALLDAGVSGVWNDMNEPSDFVDKSGETQQDVVFDDGGTKSLYAKNRNVFASNMARATYEGLERLRPDRRPFVITRAAYAGVQRYSTMWTGDNNATFASLALNIPMFASLGLSGEAFVGSDLPGFIGRGDGELLARSYEIAFLVPLCRNHGAVEDYDHEPWRYGAATEGIVRKYLKLRYQLLPFLYTTLEEAHSTGVPLFRPLVLNFQSDPNTLNLDDEFMVGDALLAAPVMQAGIRAREVYLPPGQWYDYWTNAAVAGGATFTTAAALDHVPLYVRGGSVIPSTVAMNHVGEKAWNPLRFDIYPDAAGRASGELYEDDGLTPNYLKGEFRRTKISYAATGEGTELRLESPVGAYQPGPRNVELVIHGTKARGRWQIDGQPMGDTVQESSDTIRLRWTDDSKPHVFGLRP